MADYPQVTRDDVLAAAKRIADDIVRTPLIEAEIRGHRVWLKCESLQTGGAFKLRGATNRLLQLSEDERRRGVVAFSSGNHAQGVAIAAARLSIKAIIVMPSDAPIKKIEGTRAQGADVVLYDRRTEDRVALAERIAADHGSVVVPSFDDPHIVAGQGTVGLELQTQLAEANAGAAQRIVICCGGGGLSAGIALACPEAAITIVEPQGWDDMRASLDCGHIVPVAKTAPATLCDALQTPLVSPITFDILHNRGADAVSVSEMEVVDAVRWAWFEHRLVVEPGGAVALAALLAEKVEIVPETVAILSGGNIDPDLHSKLVR
ncbi:threonine ammonia-lyase [Sphingomonas jaspsi]|uniref:threonine ammonia-lyase n=1 Tax=Sphingomonas jaspsi TaxID=392409 RepID=UPI0012EB5E8A|nr:threonine/serine dehydratase [Sphingomonas jaspsi]